MHAELDTPVQALIGPPHVPIQARSKALDTAQLTVMENVHSAKAPRVSVARITNENVPRVVGVPVIRPGLAESCKPGGSWPERSVHV